MTLDGKALLAAWDDHGPDWTMTRAEFAQAVERYIANAPDCLPVGDIVTEQSEKLDGMVVQVVQRSNGSWYERVVSAEEAYNGRR